MSDRGSSNTKGRLVAVWQPSFESPERHSLCFHDGTERPLFRKRSLLRLPRITHPIGSPRLNLWWSSRIQAPAGRPRSRSPLILTRNTEEMN
jgi:hypothetical protein